MEKRYIGNKTTEDMEKKFLYLPTIERNVNTSTHLNKTGNPGTITSFLILAIAKKILRISV